MLRFKRLCGGGSEYRKRLVQSVKSTCLPLLSLTRTPAGGHFEWMAAFCDPLFDFCERGVWIIGMLCFVLVLFGISIVVFTFYKYNVPFLYHTEPMPLFSFYFVYGHYLLINISFHYLKGVYTDPGKVTKFTSDAILTDAQMKLGWKICSKCDGPKPPRAHHCRICGRCVLKMDHHCPWMFNCVGQYNHRHFMLFIIFMWLGTSYVVHCSWSRVILHMGLYRGYIRSGIDLFRLGGGIEKASTLPIDSRTHEPTLVVIVFFICFGVTIALIMLGSWNMYLIGRGETAIEFYTNQSQRREMKRQGKKYVSPYNHGFRKNWSLFLGLNRRRSFVRHVLLPSGHSPIEDGKTWLTVNECDSNCHTSRTPTVEA